MIPKYRQDHSLERTKKKFNDYNQDELKNPLKKVKFEDNPDFAHVYNAMKLSRVELQEAIENKERIFFDAVPIDFDEVNNSVVNVI